MKRLAVPLAILASIGLIIFSGWLGYASVESERRTHRRSSRDFGDSLVDDLPTGPSRNINLAEHSPSIWRGTRGGYHLWYLSSPARLAARSHGGTEV